MPALIQRFWCQMVLSGRFFLNDGYEDTVFCYKITIGLKGSSVKWQYLFVKYLLIFFILIEVENYILVCKTIQSVIYAMQSTLQVNVIPYIHVDR